MYHTIEVATDLLVDLEISPKHRLEPLLINRGTRCKYSSSLMQWKPKQVPWRSQTFSLSTARPRVGCLSRGSHSWTRKGRLRAVPARHQRDPLAKWQGLLGSEANREWSKKGGRKAW
jgi:hypothetical protein